MDAKAIGTNSLKGACRVFLQDLNAIPAEAFAKSFGPSCRTIADIVYEVNLVNDHIGMVIRGEEPFEWPEGGWITAPEDFSSKETVVAAFEASSNKIMAPSALQGASEPNRRGRAHPVGKNIQMRFLWIAAHLGVEHRVPVETGRNKPIDIGSPRN